MNYLFVLLLFVAGSVHAGDFFSTAKVTSSNLYKVEKKSIVVMLSPSVRYEIPEGDPFRLLTAPFKGGVRLVHECALDPGSMIRISKKGEDALFAQVVHSSPNGPTFHPCQKEEKNIKITKEEFNMWRESGQLNLFEN